MLAEQNYSNGRISIANYTWMSESLSIRDANAHDLARIWPGRVHSAGGLGDAEARGAGRGLAERSQFLEKMKEPAMQQVLEDLTVGCWHINCDSLLTMVRRERRGHGDTGTFVAARHGGRRNAVLKPGSGSATERWDSRN